MDTKFVTEVMSFGVVGLLVFVPAWLSWKRRSGAATITIVALTVAHLLLHIDSLKSIAFGAMRADLREQIDKAGATIEQVRALAVTLSSVSLEALMMGGRIGGGASIYDNVEVRDQTVRELQALGASAAQIERATEAFNALLAHDLAYFISYVASQGIENMPPEAKSASACVIQLTDRNGLLPAPASRFRECFPGKLMTPPIESAISRLEHFEQTKALPPRP